MVRECLSKICFASSDGYASARGDWWSNKGDSLTICANCGKESVYQYFLGFKINTCMDCQEGLSNATRLVIERRVRDEQEAIIQLIRTNWIGVTETAKARLIKKICSSRGTTLSLVESKEGGIPPNDKSLGILPHAL
jgi:hypothetical protein